MKCIKKLFGVYEGQEVYSFSFRNDNGFNVECISYGATLKAIYFPSGELYSENKSVVMGYDALDDYLEDTYFLGSSIGRTAGRIKKAQFKLDGKMYSVDRNEGDNSLHGGRKGFHSLVWNGEAINEKKAGVRFFRNIRHKDDMFPGDMEVEIIYLLNNDNELEIIFKGTTYETTLFNPTNHAYFNLNFNQTNGILDHYLLINADKYLETDKALIPTGNMLDVNATAYDFTKERLIDDAIKILTKGYSINGGGIDTPFYLKGKLAAVLKSGDKKRSITISTDRNAVVVYTANYFNGKQTINGMDSYPYMAIAIEAQTLPDAINNEEFGDIIVKSGHAKEYKTTIKMQQF